MTVPVPAFDLSSIENYRAKISRLDGLQRSHRFEVFVYQYDVGLLSWPPISVSLPGRSFDTIPDELLAQGTNPRNIPIKRSYGGEPNVLMTLPIDQKWRVRQFFESWMDLNLAIDKEEGNIEGANKSRGTLTRPDNKEGGVGSKGSYSALSSRADVSIRFLDKQDRVRWSLNLVEPYLSMIVQDQYGAYRVNDFATITVSIAFKEYVTWSADPIVGADELQQQLAENE